MASAARVLSPEESVVLIPMSCWRISRASRCRGVCAHKDATARKARKIRIANAPLQSRLGPEPRARARDLPRPPSLAVTVLVQLLSEFARGGVHVDGEV